MKKLLLLLLGLSGALVQCTGRGGGGENVFETYEKEHIKGLDPALAYDTFSNRSLMQIYEGLLHFHYLKRPITMEPLLAESWPEVSTDGKTYKFKIKKGVKFQDSEAFKEGKGRELTAQDFIYSWKRLADPKQKSENYWVFRGKIKGLEQWREKMARGEANYDTPIEGLQAPDAHTLVIQLLQPDYQLLALLASPMTVVVAREAVEHFGAEFAANPVGTGAFQLESWTRGSRLILKKNPTYREVTYPTEGEPSDAASGLLKDAGVKLPLVDKVVIHEIVEEQPQWLSFQKGNLDMLFVPKDYMDQVVVSGALSESFLKKGMKLQLVPNSDVIYISFNTENRFLKNKKLRQAMSLAYNKPGLMKTFFNNLGTPAHGPIPPTLAGYRASVDLTHSKYDLEKAKALLREAGYPEGKGLPEFTFELGASHSTARQMAEYFQQCMSALGIKIKLNINTWAQFSEKVKKKQADIFDMSWNADYPDAENFLQMFYSKNRSPGPNNSNFNNAQYDALYEKSLQLPPGAEKLKVYERMEDLLMEESPWIFNLHRTRVMLYQGWLKNFKYEYMVLDSVKYYRIDHSEKQRLKQDL